MLTLKNDHELIELTSQWYDTVMVAKARTKNQQKVGYTACITMVHIGIVNEVRLKFLVNVAVITKHRNGPTVSKSSPLIGLPCLIECKRSK